MERVKIRKFFTRRPNDPMGALSDLSFLLIIYFLVIAGFSVNTGFLLGLPSRDKPRIVQTDDLIRLNLDIGGGLYYKGKNLDEADLDNLLTEGIKAHPNLTVALSIHPEVPYQRFIDVVKAVRGSRVENYSFSMNAGEAP